jgi:multicomponent K+:H+ antiporter subunit A
VIGGEKLPYYSLKLWHGFTPALYMSVVATLGGLFLLSQHRRAESLWNALPRPEAKVIFEAVIAALTALSRRITDSLHNGVISRYAMILIVFTVGLGYYAYATGTIGPVTREPLKLEIIPVVGWICLVAATLAIMWFHRNRLLSLVLIGVVGLIVSMAFNYLSAPDLALTQISVEVETMILLLLSLNFLPTDTPWDSSAARRWRDAAISVGAGIGTGALVYALMLRDFAFPTISEFHLANSYKGGGGTNVVNVILVDFRGFDTFGEIIVLGIAALIIFALTESVLATNVRAYLLNRKPHWPQSGDSHPLMMVVVTRMMMPIALMVGAYIFFRGHNQPGGGFIAGLIVAIAFLMQYMASGYTWAIERQRFYYHGTIGWGVLIAAATGIGAWFNDRPFLTSDFGYIHWPPLEEFEWATAILFDTGVFLAVLGAVMLALDSLSRFAWQPGMAQEFPMDINPLRDGPKEDQEKEQA